MLVYRVEKYGIGPYNYSDNQDLMEWHNSSDEHPGPYSDKLELYTMVPYPRDPRFGCTSKDALEKWFGYLLPVILNRGYSIVEYSVLDSRVWVGKSGLQCVFDKHYASM